MKAFPRQLHYSDHVHERQLSGEKDVDNTSDKYVLPWLEVVKEIKPRQVMIYTIDRENALTMIYVRLLMRNWTALPL
jgi:hypothetical protein